MASILVDVKLNPASKSTLIREVQEILQGTGKEQLLTLPGVDTSKLTKSISDSIKSAFGEVKLDDVLKIGDNVSGISKQFDSIGKDVATLRDGIVALNAALAIVGTSGASLDTIVSRLNELNSIIKEINSKTVDVSVFANATKAIQGIDTGSIAEKLVGLKDAIPKDVLSGMISDLSSLGGIFDEIGRNVSNAFNFGDITTRVQELRTEVETLLSSLTKVDEMVTRDKKAKTAASDSAKLKTQNSEFGAIKKSLEKSFSALMSSGDASKLDAGLLNDYDTWLGLINNIIEAKEVLSDADRESYAQTGRELQATLDARAAEIQQAKEQAKIESETAKARAKSADDIAKAQAKAASDAAIAQAKADADADRSQAKHEAKLKNIEEEAETRARIKAENSARAYDTKEFDMAMSNLNSSMKSALKNNLNITGIDELREKYAQLTQEIKNAQLAESGMTEEQRKGFTDRALNLEQEINSFNQAAKALSDGRKTLTDDVNKFIMENPQAYAVFGTELDQIRDSAVSSQDELDGLRAKLTEIQFAAQQAGSASGGFFKDLNSAFQKIAGRSIEIFAVSELRKGFKQVLSSVKEIDAAMTELRKVTDLTSVGYENYFDKAANIAKETGASISDTINSTADFARLGYNVRDAAELAQAALTYKNVGDGISNVENATQSIISTMKAFNIEASNAMDVVDAFNEVGNNFAISSTGIGEALERSAAALAGSGNTLEESIALVTAANEIIQDPAVVGTTIKTMTSFLRASKTEAEEMGVETDGMAESVSKLRTELMSLSGVDIMADANTYKSTFQILRELSSVWDELSDVSRANILERIGGKRGANTIQGLIRNFSTAENALKSALDSAGSATEENEKYLDSIQGKLAKLKAGFEDFSNSVVSSDTAKMFIDIANAVLSAATALSKIKLLIPILTLLGTAIGAKKNVGLASAIAQQVQLLSAANTPTTEIMTNIASSVAGMTSSQSAVFQTLINDMLQAKLVTQETADAIVNGMGESASAISNAGNAVGVFANGIGNGLKTLWSGMSMFSRVSLIASVVIGALQLIIPAFTQASERAIEAGKELTSQFDDAKKEYDSNMSQIDKLEERYNELSRGVNDNGENVSLTADEYKEYKSILSQIISISPGIVNGYDAQGNAILDYKDAIKSAREEQEQFLENSEAIYHNSENVETMFKSFASESKEAQKNFRDAGELMSTSVDEIMLSSGESMVDLLSSIGIFKDDADYNDATWWTYADVVRQIYDKREQFIAALQGVEDSVTGDKLFDTAQINLVNQDLDYMGTRLKEIRAVSESVAQYLVEDLFRSPEDIEIPIDMIDEYQEALTDAVDPEKTYNENFTIAEDLLKSFTEEYTSDIVQNLIKEAKGVADGSVELEKYNSDLQAYVDTIEDPELRKAMADYINSKAVVQSAKEYAQGIVDIGKAFESTKKYVDAYNSAQSDLLSTGSISIDSLNAMQDALGDGENVYDYLLVDENGQLQVNTQLWNQRTAAILQSEKTNIKSSIDALKEENNKLTKDGTIDFSSEIQNINNAQQALASGLVSRSRVSISSLEEEKQALIASQKQYRENEKEIARLENEMSVLGETSKTIYDPVGIQTMSDDIASFTSQYDFLNESMDKLRNGQKLNAKDILDIYASSPDLIGKVDLFGLETAEEQASALESVLGSASDAWDAFVVSKQNIARDAMKDAFRLGDADEAERYLDVVKLFGNFIGQWGEISASSVDNVASASDAISSLGSNLEAISNLSSSGASPIDSLSSVADIISQYNEAMGLTGTASAKNLEQFITGVDEFGKQTFNTEALKQMTIEMTNLKLSMAGITLPTDVFETYIENTTEATIASENLSNAIDSITSVSDLISGAQAGTGRVNTADVIPDLQELADTINQLHASESDWENIDYSYFTDGFIGSDTILNLQKLRDAMYDLVAVDKELTKADIDQIFASAIEPFSGLSDVMDTMEDAADFINKLGGKAEVSEFADMFSDAEEMATNFNSLMRENNALWQDVGADYFFDPFEKTYTSGENANHVREYTDAIVDAYAQTDAYLKTLNYDELTKFKDQFYDAQTRKSMKNMVELSDDLASSFTSITDSTASFSDRYAAIIDIVDTINSIDPDSGISITDFFNLDDGSIKDDMTFVMDWYDKYIDASARQAGIQDGAIQRMKTELRQSVEQEKEYSNIEKAISGINSAKEYMTKANDPATEFIDMLSSAVGMLEDMGDEYSLDDFFKIMDDGTLDYQTSGVQTWLHSYVEQMLEAAEISDELKQKILDTADATITGSPAKDKAVNSQSKITAALDAYQSEGVELTYSAYQTLIDANSRYASAVEYSNGIMQINSEKYNAVTQSLLAEAKAQAIVAKAEIMSRQAYQDLMAAKAAGQPYDTQALMNLQAEIMSYDIMISEYEHMNDEFAKFNRSNKEAIPERVSTMKEAAEQIKNVVENKNSDLYKMYGNEGFQTALDLFIDPNIQMDTPEWDAAYKKFQKQVDRYFSDNEQKNFHNFYQDLQSAGYITEGGFFSDDVDVAKMADDLNLTIPALRSMIDLFNEYQKPGHKIDTNSLFEGVDDGTKTAEEQVEELKAQIKTLEDTIEELKASPVELDVSPAIQAIQTVIDKLAEAWSSIFNGGSGVQQTGTPITPTNTNTDGGSKGVSDVSSDAEDFMDQYGEMEIKITADTDEASSAIDELDGQISGLIGSYGDTKLSMSADTSNATSSLSSLEGAINSVKNAASGLNPFSVSVTGVSSAQTQVSALASALSSVSSQLSSIRSNSNVSINITRHISTVGSSGDSGSGGVSGLNNGAGVAMASGNAAINGKHKRVGGKTLVGELGRETVVDPYTNTWYTVGNRGAEFVDLPKDAIVFNAEQTRRLLGYGKVKSRGVAMASGVSGGYDPTVSSGFRVKTTKTEDNTNIQKKKTSSSKKSTSANKAEAKSAQKLAEAYDNLSKEMEVVIGVQEEWYYYIAERARDYQGMEAALRKEVEAYETLYYSLQNSLSELYAQGLNSSDENVAKLEQNVGEMYHKIQETYDRIIDLYVNGLTNSIDDLQAKQRTFNDALDEFNEHGAISIDTFQSILENGIQYLAYLQDANGQLVINEESIKKMLMAQKEQLAIEEALAYLERMKMAMINGETQEIEFLTRATDNLSSNTWALVYSYIEVFKQYDTTGKIVPAMLSNINKLRDLSGLVTADILDDTESVSEQLERQSDSIDKILEYTKDLVKYESEQQVNALNKQIDDYKKIIDLKKESLETSKDEADYQKSIEEKVKDIADIQTKADKLALDGSRSAMAERAKLLEELSQRQDELAELQADHSYDAQMESLDKMSEQFEEDTQAEIDRLEETLSSEEKLYREAIARIESGWDTLYSELLDWNYEAGNVLNSEITDNWNHALSAAQEYGSYLQALVGIYDKLNATGDAPDNLKYIVENLPKYHSGGIVGNEGSINPREAVAILEKGEIVLDEQKQSGLFKIINFQQTLSKKLGTVIKDISSPLRKLIPDVTKATAGATVTQNSSVVFSPVIDVHIEGSTMNNTNAVSYGNQIADTVLDKLYSAFEKRGMNNVLPGFMKA